MTLIEIARMTEEEAREYLEKIRWPNGPVCPHCGGVETYELHGKSHRPGLHKCKYCRQQFTVTVNTIMHGSHIPLSKWLLAFYMMCSSRKGVSALQLKRQLGLGCYQTAWHMAHRIREAMTKEPLSSLLSGTVEVDETYVGGRKHGGKRGRGTAKKPVLAMIERDGDAIAKPVKRVNKKTLLGEVQAHVSGKARIVTDEWKGYRGFGKFFSGGHDVVKHSEYEYVRGDVFTNTAESFFAVFKRTYRGIYHWFSRKHMQRYCNEIAFRWNCRKLPDFARVEAAIRGARNKRLLYTTLVAGCPA